MDYESISAVQKDFEGKDLCFIGKLLHYTDLEDRRPVDPEHEFVQGMEFELIWNMGEKKERYWVHICGGFFKGEIFGPVGETYAVTFEGIIFPENELKPDWWPWGGCADYYRYKRIRIEQDGAEQPATAPEPKPEGDQKPKPESGVRPQ